MSVNKALSILAIICLGTIVYSNTYFCSFHFDDDAYIVNNYAIRNIQNLHAIWNVCPCRFITFLSIALNYHFHRLDVFGYHLFNIAVHCGTAILVWWLILLTFTTPVIKNEKISNHSGVLALLAALIFVSHPVQIEAVTYIWQRAASLAAFFYLLSLCFYIQSRLLQDSVIAGCEPTKRSFKIYYIFSLITAVLAMFTKENAITLPLMILLYEFFFLKTNKGINWAQLYPYWLIMFIIPQTMVLTKTTRIGEIRSVVDGPGGISPIHYLLTQFRVMMTYLRLLVLPINLNLDYDYPIFKSFFQMPVVTSFLCLTAIFYFAKRAYLKYRLISFSIAWFFLTLLPESSLLPQADVIFEHRLYLPMVGYCVFLVCGAYYLLGKNNIKSMLIALSLFITFYSVLTYQRNKTWKNEIILWNDVVQKSPNKARPYINRGWAYYNEGNLDQAMSDYNKAINISAAYIYPFDDKGLIYAKKGNFQQAIAEYDKAIKINPYYAKVYYHRAQAYYKMKNYAQALLDYNKALKIEPDNMDINQERSQLYAQHK